MTMSDRNDDLLFFAGLVLGAIVGGAAAALLTPQSGTEIREQVAERGLELKNRADDAVQRAQQVAADAVAKVQSTAQDFIKQPSEDLVSGGGGI
jgi:gas vesicle protein